MTRFATGLVGFLAIVCGPGWAESIRPPVPKDYPSPVYPDEMDGSGLDGRAEITFTVLEDGSVADPAVRSASHPAFAQAALDVIGEWRFKPGQRNGRIESMRVALPFVFHAGPVRRVNALLGRVVYKEIDDLIFSPVEVGGLPEIVHRQVAPYPRSLQGSGQTEIVNLTLVVGPDGRGYNMEIEGYPPKPFPFLAIVAASHYRFRPVIYRGEPVHVYTRLSIVISENAQLARQSGDELIGSSQDPFADYPDF